MSNTIAATGPLYLSSASPLGAAMLDPEDIIMLVGLQAMQLQQGKIQNHYDKISEHQALTKNINKAMRAAADIKRRTRLEDVKFDFTDPMTGATTKMDLKTFMDRFCVQHPDPKREGFIGNLANLWDQVKVVVDFVKSLLPPEAVRFLDELGAKIEKALAPLTGALAAAGSLVAVGVLAGLAGAAIAIALESVVAAPLAIVVALPLAFALGGVGMTKLAEYIQQHGIEDIGHFILKELLPKLFDSLLADLQRLSIDQWREIEQNLRDTADTSDGQTQKDQLLLSQALNHYGEITQQLSNNMSKLNQAKVAVISNMR